MTIAKTEHSVFKLGGFTGTLLLYIRTYLTKAPLVFIFSALSELGLIVILWISAGSNYLPIAITGSIVSISILMGIGQLPVDLRGLNESKFRYMLVASPVNSIAFIIAETIGASIHLIIQILILFLVLIILTNISLASILEICLSLFLLWLFGVSFGYYLSVRNISRIKLRQTTQILRLGLTLFVPIYYPVSKLPYILGLVTLLVPTTNTAIIIRNTIGSFDGVNGVPLIFNWLILILWTIFAFIILIKSSKWEDE